MNKSQRTMNVSIVSSICNYYNNKSNNFSKLLLSKSGYELLKIEVCSNIDFTLDYDSSR